MTQRERHTPAIGGPAPAMATSPNGAGPACAWEELFQAAAPGRRQQLIALAGREGVLYAHELPPPGNGAAARPLLPALLNGQLHDLSPLRLAALPCDEFPLDDSQRDAVARALQTPDLCLIQGYPGSGKSHTAAEIAARAAARGERVLLLAPTAAAVDCVLERLDGRDGVCAARCPAAGEKAESLPPGLRRLAFAERLRLFHEHTLPAAKQAADEAGRRLAQRRAEEGVWSALDEIAGRLRTLAEEKRRLAEGLSRVEEEVGAETEGAAPFHQELAACRAGRDEALARIDARLAELRAEGEKVRGEGRAADDEAARLRPLAEALTSGRWWTGAWWTARREGDLPKRLGELEGKRNELAQAQDHLTREAAERTAERDAAEARHQETADRLRREEVGRRRAEGEGRLAALALEQASLEQKAEAARRDLGAAAPADLSPAGVAAARAAWHGLLEQDERQAAQASQWAGAVESMLATLPERLARCVNVVGAVTSALAADPHFGDHASGRTPFDLLILEEAHLVTESEFLSAARRARRWVLVGEPTDDASAPRQATRPSALRPGFFQRLWRLLHADPRALPYAWIDRGGRLVCRLRPAAPGEERWVESERLADRPEIELRIAAPPRTPPRLLEVAFPGTTDICEAKEFIYRELGELTVEARGGAFVWRENGDRVTLDLSDGDAPGPAGVELAAGVRERLTAAAPGDDAARHTATLEFARAAGWTRERAEQWVEEHLQTRALGRTALLTAPHRCLPSLARFLSSLLFDGACGAAVADGPPAVEFVPVPPPDRGAARRRDDESLGRQGGTATAAPRLRQARGGAGLEIDLGDPRRLDPLPADLRAALPGRGLVNLFEARAVVRRLEGLAADPAFRAAAEEWARGAVRPTGAHSSACRGSSLPCAGRRPAVAVLALHFAQAELIRLLMTQSPALSASPLAVEVGTPDAFRHRECFAAVVSLTRSHSHRAVPFGDDPTFLPTALTRAAARLVLFGDPGTLARRCQWNGAIDHLDETAGERERRLIARITAYLHGDGPHPTLFRLDESAGV